jgi:hypothetical protein
MGKTLGDLAKEFELDKFGSYDFALPQYWVDEVRKVTRGSPVGIMIWFYPFEGNFRIFGTPLALTKGGEMLLEIFNKLTGSFYITDTQAYLETLRNAENKG